MTARRISWIADRRRAGGRAARPASPLDLEARACRRASRTPASQPHPTPPTETALDKIPVDKLKLPAGFKAEIWSHGHPGGRTMVTGPKGTVFMGTRAIGRVYAITEKDGKREVKIILQGLTQPNGLAVKDGALYVLAIHRVLRYDNIEDKLDNLGEPGRPDRQVRSPAGGPPQLEIRSVRPRRQALHPGRRALQHLRDQSRRARANPPLQCGRIAAWRSSHAGCRNTVGFDWHPVTKELWFTDHGRDWVGNEGPQDELNRIAKGQEGANFGFPYCHANGIADAGHQAAESLRRRGHAGRLDRPAFRRARHQVLHRRHVPGDLQECRLHRPPRDRGTGRRSSATTWRLPGPRPNGTARIEPFMTGLLDEGKNEFYGRPTYVLQMPDGALLVSDEQNGATYRISYSAPVARHREAKQQVTDVTHRRAMVAVAGPRAGGRRALRRLRFAQSLPLSERITLCGTCHGEDGNSRMREHSLACRPAGILPVQPAGPDARGRAPDRGDDAVRQGSQGQRDASPGQAFRRACTQGERRADRSSAGQARRRACRLDALRFLPPADLGRTEADAAAGETAHRLPDPFDEGVPRQYALRRRHAS